MYAAAVDVLLLDGLDIVFAMATHSVYLLHPFQRVHKCSHFNIYSHFPCINGRHRSVNRTDCNGAMHMTTCSFSNLIAATRDSVNVRRVMLPAVKCRNPYINTSPPMTKLHTEFIGMIVLLAVKASRSCVWRR